MIHPADIADALQAGLLAQAQAEDLEQAVYGFDARAELALHPLVQQSLAAAGFGIFPEQRFPSDREHARKSKGQRCDLVLTPPGPHGPAPLRDPQAKATLFDDEQAVDLAEAYWLEIKTVAQFETTGPFRRYSSELFSPVVDDVKKLWNDSLLRYAGLLLLLFTATPEVAEHDLAVWHERCLRKGCPLAMPAVRGVKLTDRIGNGWCAIAVFGVRGV